MFKTYEEAIDYKFSMEKQGHIMKAIIKAEPHPADPRYRQYRAFTEVDGKRQATGQTAESIYALQQEFKNQGYTDYQIDVEF